MTQLVILKLGSGSFVQGFPVTLQIGDEASRPSVEVTGTLPPAPKLGDRYTQWQVAYRGLGLSARLEKPKKQKTQVSRSGLCTEAAQQLKDHLNQWLNSEEFRPIKEALLKKLQSSEVIRFIIQTQELQHQQLPWHFWTLLVEDYTKAEIALSSPEYQDVEWIERPGEPLKILAILGNSEGIDVQADRELLQQLPGAEVTFLVEPKRKELTDTLWAKGWDILCFSGHSSTEGETGKLAINQTDSLTVAELKNALKTSIAQGLRLAIFNSCDGLGLARNLADLHIPQVIVMREPVPDVVAQEFLKYFLKAFARGQSLYLSVREARERLQGIEDQFPCATWLPVIYQNPATLPPTWEDLGGICADIGSEKILACPYRGLSAFREEDAPYFLGRETFTEQLIQAVHEKPFVAVIGASGSGKSSVVFAGLIPQWRSDNHIILSIRPGDQPFVSLATALIPHLDPQLSETDQLIEAKKLASALSSQAISLREVIERILSRSTHITGILLVIDQFEELYTLGKNLQERQQWLESWLSAIKVIAQLKVVITLRADFFTPALSYRPLADALHNADVKLGPMNREELERTITQPAAKAGMLIEEGLTDRILEAVQAEPGNLPLLEFALTLLWEHPRNGRLNHAAYKEIGGVELALTRYAQEVYDRLDGTEQEIAKRIFLELTQLGEGAQETRRQVSKQELQRIAPFPSVSGTEELVESVIQKLAAAKLVVTNETSVDIVHEALIRHWPLLREWLEENREQLLRQRAIEGAAKEWQKQGEPEELSYLLQGVKLADAESLLDSEGIALSSLARDYIIISQAVRDRLLQEEEDRRERELQQERKARIAAQRTTLAAVASFLIILIAGGFSWWQRQQSLRILQDVSAGIEVGTPQLLSLLPDFFKIANQQKRRGEIDRALAYYRTTLTESKQLLQPAENEAIQLSAAEQEQLENLVLDTEQALVETIISDRLPELEAQLSQGGIGQLLDETSLLDYEEQYTEGALKTTYAILLREWGTKADLNDDGELQTPEEAEYLPCDLLKAIDALWRKHTGDRCGWFAQDSAYQSAECEELDELTLTQKIFLVPPFDAAINRLNSCDVTHAPVSLNP
jgi:hypothetical protein